MFITILFLLINLFVVRLLDNKVKCSNFYKKLNFSSFVYYEN